MNIEAFDNKLLLLVLLSSLTDYIIRNYRCNILRDGKNKERYGRSLYSTVLEKFVKQYNVATKLEGKILCAILLLVNIYSVFDSRITDDENGQS
jgi:hypothetical protein